MKVLREHRVERPDKTFVFEECDLAEYEIYADSGCFVDDTRAVTVLACTKCGQMYLPDDPVVPEEEEVEHDAGENTDMDSAA